MWQMTVIMAWFNKPSQYNTYINILYNIKYIKYKIKFASSQTEERI